MLTSWGVMSGRPSISLQGQYLLGLKGPAQCVNFEDGPMKVHLVPRNGDKLIVSLAIDVVSGDAGVGHACCLQQRCSVH